MTTINLDELPEAKITQSRWPSPVWLIPIIAALIGGWLFYQHWYARGPIIKVHFPSAEGIVEGQTNIRHKHVVIGRVEKVKLERTSPDEPLSPTVYMRINRDVDHLLGCNAQFWVVRPRIKGAEITGLGTLFSGTYISMRPRPAWLPEPEEDNSILPSFDRVADCYVALEDPPIVRPDDSGRRFILEAESLGSIDVGTPVFHKQLQMGEVIDYKIKRRTSKIRIEVFIYAPYYVFVTDRSRFWNVSGIEFKLDSSGAEMKMESLSSLLIGGIAFDTPQNAKPAAVSAEDAEFTLFKNYKTSRNKFYPESERLHYVMHFSGSVRGLKVGAPVEYQGIPVGRVDNIEMNMNPDTLEVTIPVLVYIDPQRFSETITREQAKAMMQRLVSQEGVRAKLSSSSLLTGEMYVALAKQDNPEKAEIEERQFGSIFPTNPAATEEITRIAANIAEEVEGTLKSIRQFVESKQLDKAIQSADVALQDAGKFMRQADKTVAELESVIRQVGKQTLPSLSKDLNTIATAVESTSGTANKVMVDVAGSIKSTSGTANKVMVDVAGSIKSTSGTANRVMMDLSGTGKKLGHDVTRVSNDLVKTMRRLQNSLGHFDRLTARNSPTQYQLMEMMEEVTAAARAVRELSERLERQPDALIRGRR